MLLDSLRETTRPHHRAIEQNRLLAAVLRPELTRDLYVQVLAKFYGFLRPLEELLRRSSTDAGSAALLKHHVKTALLERDLAQLGIDPEAQRSLPLCDQLPASDRPAARMGILYVIEGSTLGGQVIAGAVKGSLGIDAGSGCAFFTGYGSRTRAMWKDTCRVLEEFGQGAQAEQAEILAAAADTFYRLDRWFQNLDTSSK
jgi:heme oxygenase